MQPHATVSILGAEYTVELVPDLGDEVGVCDGDTRSITLLSSLDETQLERTYFHEVMHAILFESGVHFVLGDNTAEAVVRALEHGLTQLGLKIKPSTSNGSGPDAE